MPAHRSTAVFPTLRLSSLALALAGAFCVPAQAIQLIAIGELNGSAAGLNADLSGLTGTLENGLPGNLLGGMGSGLAWAGGNTFVSVPDRGPNATPYNALVDNTASYISRFQSLTMTLSANAAGSALAYSLTPTLTATTLLSSKTPLVYGTGALGTGGGLTLGSGTPALNAINHTDYFTGRSDNFDATKNSLNPNNGRFDPEGVRVSNDGKSVFISDEYGPYVYQFDRATGQRVKAFELPGNLAVSTLGPTTAAEDKPINTTGRVANKGMEGLAITPDGKTLVGIMQAPLLQDTKKNVRIVTIDIASGATHEYAYKLTDGSGVSEITAVNDHVFLVDERDGAGLGDGTAAVAKKLFKIDLNDVNGVNGPSKELVGGVKGDLTAFAVPKTEFLDVKAALVNAGYTAEQVPAKLEGLTFGQDVVVGGKTVHTLWVANDNDFVSASAGPNKFFVFGVSDSDLGTSLVQQSITSAVPEPASLALMLAGLGVVGWAGQRRRRQS